VDAHSITGMPHTKIRSPQRSSHPSQGSPHILRPVLGGSVWADRWLELERRRGMQKSLAAGQGKTVPGTVSLRAAGRNVPCRGKSRTRTSAGGRPLTWAVQKALWGRCRASTFELTPAGASGHGCPTRGTLSVRESGRLAAAVAAW
jgi:hypothetical protein